jgi:hypothetical protein
VEGFADSFFAFFRAVYSDVAAGGRQAGATWATFEDGHLRDGVLRRGSALGREGRWVNWTRSEGGETCIWAC